MLGDGLKEVKNPSAIFLSLAVKITAVAQWFSPCWEGTRPLLVEINKHLLISHSCRIHPPAALLSAPAKQNRLALLLAVFCTATGA